MESLWHISWRADPAVRPIADRHYNRQKVGAKQFAPPGRVLVLRRPHAFWMTSWPIAKYVKHAWAGAWVNSAFRREPEDPALASDLILSAIAATRWYYGWAPEPGLVSFVDATKVARKRDPGRCFIRAGFKLVGHTEEEGLLAFLLRPEEMPTPERPWGATERHRDWVPDSVTAAPSTR